MNWSDYLQSKYNQFVRLNCREKKCCLNLSSIDRTYLTILHSDNSGFRAIFSLEDQPLCDYLVFYIPEEFTIVALELKGGNADAHHAFEQLKNGVHIIKQILDSSIKIRLVPVLLYKSIDPMESRYLKNNTIDFRGKPYPITPGRCGAELQQIIG